MLGTKKKKSRGIPLYNRIIEVTIGYPRNFEMIHLVLFRFFILFFLFFFFWASLIVYAYILLGFNFSSKGRFNLFPLCVCLRLFLTFSLLLFRCPQLVFPANNFSELPPAAVLLFFFFFILHNECNSDLPLPPFFYPSHYFFFFFFALLLQRDVHRAIRVVSVSLYVVRCLAVHWLL